MVNPKVFRYACDAVFSDGKHVTLRDFHCQAWAERWAADNEQHDFYPGRVYRLEIVRFEVIPEQEGP